MQFKPAGNNLERDDEGNAKKCGSISIAEAVVLFETSVRFIYKVIVYVTVKPNVLRYRRETCSPIGQ